MAMLYSDDVIPFLGHADPIIYGHALSYFEQSSDFGSLTADHYWAQIDRLGQCREALGFSAHLANVPQTDESVKRLIAALSSNPPRDFEHHYQQAIGTLDLDTLARHRAEILPCSALTEKARKRLEYRLEWSEKPPEAAWKRLLELGIELKGKYYGEFDSDQIDALIETAARGGAAVCDEAIAVLSDKSAEEDWRELFAADLIGHARYQPAIDPLIQKLLIDSDTMEGMMSALIRVGSVEVVEKLTAFYPGKPWATRLFASPPLARIKHPRSVEGLMKMLSVEQEIAAKLDTSLQDDSDFDPDAAGEDEEDSLIEQVLRGLTDLASMDGLEVSRNWISDNSEDPEALDLCSALVATAAMTNTALSEESQWRGWIKKHNARFERRIAYFPEPFGHEPKIDWEKPIQYESPPQSHEKIQPIRNMSPKIGRNDPCPCGSNKKYKKCCGR